MNEGQIVFSQITNHLPMQAFHRCVQRYRGHYKVKSFSCLDQFLCMAFAQLTYRDSLRDIEAGLRAQQSKLYHMGIRGHVARTTLAKANETRDWRIYADFAQTLIAIARPLYAEDDLGVDLKQTVYALDSTTIDLCLKLFPWAPFQRSKAAIKLHTLLDLRGNIPTVIHISDGRWHDARLLDELLVEPGAFYVMDRGYLHFKRLYALNQAGAFFVTRARAKFHRRRVTARPVDKTAGLICDQTVRTTGRHTKGDYPDNLRRIRYRDPDTAKSLVFLTNSFTVAPLAVADLYKCRWQVELFFKWIKQHLRIKRFFGTSENAVKTQIWIAVCGYVLIAIIKKRLHLDLSLHTILSVLSLTSFERIPLFQLLNDYEPKKSPPLRANQLNLFD